MKLDFLMQPVGERRLYFEQAAVRRNLSPVILEKDFWCTEFCRMASSQGGLGRDLNPDSFNIWMAGARIEGILKNSQLLPKSGPLNFVAIFSHTSSNI